MGLVSRAREALVTLMVVTAITASRPVPAGGQTSYNLDFCRRVEPRAGVGLVTRQCGTTFTTADAYVGLVVQLYNVQDSVMVSLELQDPEQAVVWKASEDIQVRAGYYYPVYSLWAVLPVAADEAALAAEHPRLASQRIRLEGRPARERLGEWTLGLRMNNGRPLKRKFTLR